MKRSHVAAMVAFVVTALVISVLLTMAVTRAHAQDSHMKMGAPAASQDAPKPSAAELQQATPAMSGGMESMHDHDDMGPHMFMSTLMPMKPGDEQRAQQIVDEARAALEPYQDWHKAEADGFRMFAPNVKNQPMYHFTNWRYAMEAAFKFDPAHPTSLLYKKNGPDSYKLVGAMYTAPKRFSEAQLDERIPLSVAQWHKHVNLCVPPGRDRKAMAGAHPLFGLRGSITTKEQCDQAGGTFRPEIFGWMVHIYPYEKDMASIWSLEPQKQNMQMNMR